MRATAFLVGLLAMATACGDDGGNAIDAAPAADALTAECTPTTGTAITIAEVASGLVDPLFVTSPPGDPRLFILEQPGRIRIVENGQLLDTPFLDISADGSDERVDDGGNEQGLLGLAFHPDYAQNGRFFVNYTADNPNDATIVAEYAVSSDPDRASTEETRLMTIPQFATNHNGGMIAFGPDGYLYVGMGDGGGGGDPEETGQDTTRLLGAMLRIDVDGAMPYGIPDDNPFADSANGEEDPRPEIWAIGLRNPWRFSFDQQTGDLYIGDVGQNTQEEISVLPAGATPPANFGWDVIEGTTCHEPETGDTCDDTGMIPPVATHDHLPQGQGGPCSITGGYVYRGACLPDLQGWYFYADYCTSEVWRFRYQDGAAADHQLVDGFLGSSITSFGEDATGELYIVSREGTVYRIVAGS